MRGGLVPPMCLAAMDEEGVLRRTVIDGLQRAHVETIALMALEAGEEVDDYVAEQIAPGAGRCGRAPPSWRSYIPDLWPPRTLQRTNVSR